ncbi:class II aldolase/adducin family protein [Dictyobacter kobayashii]|uniref:Aldolase n=1 Tax=Dictyobacter kobayashii TaxID=2014872 RepID=A0A402AML1_9CHLR|nr:class II aldolase/adducin family protein [Dictyobacter kobayashii]GCE20265.1 aldolase [Dictyobacter kobayashii]
MLLTDLRTQVARYARKMYESQLVRATQGNLSARDPETNLICITPSGADYQLLAADDIIVVDEQGKIVEGKWKPSVETPLHTYILSKRRDINCVMHTHALYTSAFGVVYQPLPMILQESASCLGGEVPIVPYQESGTQAFAELVAQTLGEGPAVIWGNHGAMVVGINLALTFSIAHALEDTARIYSIAKQLGTPVTLPAEEVAKLHNNWKQGYRQTAIEDPLNAR